MEGDEPTTNMERQVHQTIQFPSTDTQVYSYMQGENFHSRLYETGLCRQTRDNPLPLSPLKCTEEDPI